MNGDRSARRLRVTAFSAVDLSLPQGHALHLRGLLDPLHRLGHRVVLVTPRPRGPLPATEFRTIAIPILRWRALGPWSFELLGGLRLLFECLRRRPHLIYVRHDLYTTMPAVVAAILRVPLAVEVDASAPEELAILGKGAALRLVSVCERFTLRRASLVLVLAEEHGRDLVARTGIAPARIRTVPIGARIPEGSDPVRTREELGIDPGTFLVGFAGNLSPIQGVDLLLDAFQTLSRPGLALWIIGTGTEERVLRARSARLAGRVRFFGGVAREESERLLAACQLLVAPYREEAYRRTSGGGALSSKVMTYLAVDRPVLLSNLPGYGWLEEIGAGGRVPSGDPSALARAIDAWVERWREAGAPITGWPWPSPGPGRRFVEAGRTWEDAARRVAAILEDLAAPEDRSDPSAEASSGGRPRRSRGR